MRRRSRNHVEPLEPSRAAEIIASFARTPTANLGYHLSHTYQMPVDPFRLHAAGAPWPARLAVAAASPLLSWVLRLPLYRRLYADSTTRSAPSFIDRALETLRIQASVSAAD